ncbi:MAG: flagellar motor protein MotB [Phycisphaerales bacterium]|jgi:chemotaxis protein MotB|nr:flagellar motor protein MotB [Phycisphaerales bacterium]
MGKKKGPESPPIPEWVLTYGDMMSLLLCFFILLSAFSELKKPREYQKVLEAIREALGSSGSIGQIPIEGDPANSMVSLLEEIKNVDHTRPTDAVQVDPNMSGTQERVQSMFDGPKHLLAGDLDFDPGSATLSERAKVKLKDEVTPKVRGIRQVVMVRGHAWGLEDRAGGLDLDELSYRRAQAVKDFLVRECGVDPRVLRVVASGDSEPREVGVGSGGASNRRVDLLQTETYAEDLHPDFHGTGRTLADPGARHGG